MALWLLFAVFLLVCSFVAEVADGRTHSLIGKTRANEASPPSPSAPTQNATSLAVPASVDSDVDAGLLDLHNQKLTIIGTIDGYIHAVNPEKNEKVWTTELPGGAMASSHHPKTVKVQGEGGNGASEDAIEGGGDGGGADAQKDKDFSVIPTTDGALLIHSMQGMRKTSVKARVLAEKAPFLSQEGLLFTGQTTSRILGVDIGSGKIVHDSGSDEGKRTLGFLRNKDRLGGGGRDPLWIGRVDYTVRAYNEITGREQFNVTYSELKPLASFRDGIIGATALTQNHGGGGGGGSGGSGSRAAGAKVFGSRMHQSRQAIAAAPSSNGGAPVSLFSTPEGDLVFSDGGGNLLSSVSLGAAAISAFNVRGRRAPLPLQAGALHPPPEYEVTPVKVAYRMNKLDLDEGEESDYYGDPSLEGGEHVVVVQSLANGGLYALEIPLGSQDAVIGASAIGKRDASGHLSLPAPTVSVEEEGPDDGDVVTERSIAGALTDSMLAVVRPGKLKRPHVAMSRLAGSTLGGDKSKLVPRSSGERTSPAPAPASSYQARRDECVAFPHSFASHDELDFGSSLSHAPLCLVGNHRLVMHDDTAGGSVFSSDSFLAQPEATFEPEFKGPRTPYQVVYDWMRVVEAILIRFILAALLLAGVLFWLRRAELLPPFLAERLDVLVRRHLSFGAKELPFSRGADEFSPRPEALATLSAGPGAAEIVEYDEQGNKVTCVGSIRIQGTVLGYGSHGTLVLKGSLNGRPVAVKRMLSQFNRAADREIALLIRSDGHANVVRYFLREQSGEFVYLALQLCRMSLRDFVMHIQRSKVAQKRKGAAQGLPEASAEGLSPEDRKLTVLDIPNEARRGLLQIAEGLAHLHSQRIVHRDIKPHNILLALPDDMANLPEAERNEEDILNVRQLGNYTLKISDMGLSKQLDREEGSFASMSFSMPAQNGEESSRSSTASTSAREAMAKNPVGTIGWQAPELMALRRSVMAPAPSIAEGRDGEDDGTEEEEEEEDDDNDDNDDEEDDEEEGIDEEEDESELDTPEDEATDTTAETASKGTASSSSLTGADLPKPKPVTKTARKTQTVDIFSLGCVFHYVLVPGEHPFGQWFEREANIMTNKLELSHLQGVPDALDLLTRMLRADPGTRPSALQVCGHPFFWSDLRRLDFLTELSDRLEHEAADACVVLAIERNAATIVGRSWDKRLDSALLDDMNKYRKYDTTSVRDLLRVVRNKRHHFHELTEAAKALVAPLPTGFVNYFEAKFPSLLMHCVQVACTYLRRDKGFHGYCHTIAPLLAAPRAGVDEAKVAAGGGDEGDASDPGGAPATRDHGHQASTRRMVLDDGLVVWQGSALAEATNTRGWHREASAWVDGTAHGQAKSAAGRQRPAHVVRSSTDMRFRSRLCTHWEVTFGANCPMRKKNKCDFAHGPMELRVKENRRDRWGRATSSASAEASLPESTLLRLSGGEDVLGAARKIEVVRQAEGSGGDLEKRYAGRAPVGPMGAGGTGGAVAPSGGGQSGPSTLKRTSAPFVPRSFTPKN